MITFSISFVFIMLAIAFIAAGEFLIDKWEESH